MVRHRLGKMATTLYALESVTYMTAGLADASPMAGPAHIEMEACMTKSFALGSNSIETFFALNFSLKTHLSFD